MDTTYTDLDCCSDSTLPNPKAELRRKRGQKGMSLFTVKNPIPDEVADSDELKTLFSKYNFVPYAGTSRESGHSLLVWYLMLAKLSPTHGACIQKKTTYAVGTKPTPIVSVDPEWDTGESVTDLSANEKVLYRDAVNEFFAFEGGIRQFNKNVSWSIQATGNAWAEVTFSEVMGTGRINVKYHKPTYCLYLNTKPGEMKIVAISPSWDEGYINKKEPRYVPLFPNFAKTETGELKTIFHLKTGTNSWYGRPTSQSGDLYKYREVQDALYTVKQSAANFTGQLIIEVEDDDPQMAPAIEDEKAQGVGFSSFAERFEHNYSQKADEPQSVLLTARPFGSRPMFVFQVAPNTNQEWYKVTGEIAEQKILRAHECTLRFMSFDVSNGFSTDAFISDYVINMEPAINALRDTVTGFTNQILSAGWDLLGKMDMNRYSITFTEPIKTIVDSFKYGSTNAQPDNSVRSSEI